MLMQRKRSFINQEQCQNCETCLAQAVCPTKAIVRDERDEPLYIDLQCIGCGKCVRHCPNKAIRLI